MKSVLFLCLGLLLATNQAVAHHSFAASFIDEEIEAEGVVERYVFKNPHVIMYLNVTDEEGNQTRWMVEGSAATSLRRQGWSNDTMHTQHEYADMLLKRGEPGDREKALELLTHALDTAQELGMKALLDKAGALKERALD